MLEACLKLLILILATSLSSGAAAQIYKIVHPDGRVEYTDEPPEGDPVEQVELPALILQPGVPIPEAPEPAATAKDDEEPAGPPSLNISSPTDETVVHGSGRRVEFVINAQNRPEGSSFQLVQNGASTLSSESPRFDSPILFPGTQTFRVNLLSSDGETLATTAPVRIYVIP